MCVICQQLRPWAPKCDFLASAPKAGGKETWSLDQIADQLLTEYWGLSVPRAFALGPDRTLTYDASALSDRAKETARAALEEWGAVTGITFEPGRDWVPAALRREAVDAAASTATQARAGLGEAFDGRVTSPGDRDWVRVDLPANQIVLIRLAGLGTDPLDAPAAVLRDGRGRLLDFQWHEAEGATEIAVATGDSPATIFVEAAGASGDTGDYRLTLRDPEAEGEPDIVFGEDRSGAFAEVQSRGELITRADVNVAAGWLDSYGSEPGTYGFQAYLHEIGHALGLGHAGSYNGSARYGADALYANDSWQASVMSYFSQTENTAIDADRAFVVTPMAADLVAVARTYGDSPAHLGDTVYGEGSTAGGALDLVADRAAAFTVSDAGGHDLIDLGGQAEAQHVDLRRQAVSDVFGLKGNMVIAHDTTIEDLRLGRGDDTGLGNRADNWIRGGSGDDVLSGRRGADVMRGGRGDDRLDGGDDEDDLRGDKGDDHLTGAADRDALRGGGGHDLLQGGAGDDTLRGGGGNDRLEGGAGGDLVIGGRGDDVLSGGAGADVFLFGRKPFGDDRILDFGDVSGELIDLTRIDGLDFGGLDFGEEDGDAVLDLGPMGAVRFMNVAVASLDAGHFEFAA